MSTALDRAIHKAEHNYRKSWCGYFTPTEILLLMDNGAVPAAGQDWVLSIVKEKKAKGDCFPTWFYFTPKKELEEKLNTLGSKAHPRCKKWKTGGCR